MSKRYLSGGRPPANPEEQEEGSHVEDGAGNKRDETVSVNNWTTREETIINESHFQGLPYEYMGMRPLLQVSFPCLQYEYMGMRPLLSVSFPGLQYKYRGMRPLLTCQQI